MVNNLINLLRDINPDYMENHSTYSCRLDAEYILDNIEKLGILPPSYNINKGCADFGISSYYVNEWEDEE